MVRRAAATNGVDEIDSVAFFEEPGCPTFSAIGSIEEILAETSETISSWNRIVSQSLKQVRRERQMPNGTRNQHLAMQGPKPCLPIFSSIQ